MSIDPPECRICFEGEIEDDPFLYPCHCRGTSKYVHKSCLNTWRHFNRGNPAFKKCMECNKEYIVNKNYEYEEIQIYYCFPHLPSTYFFFNACGCMLASFLWIMEYMYYANPHEAHKSVSRSSLFFAITHNELDAMVWFYSLAIFIEAVLFYGFFGFFACKKIKRGSSYFHNIKKIYILNMIFTLQYIIYYLLFVNNALVLLNLIGPASIIHPLIVYKLIVFHEKTIISMNDEVEEEVVSFESNPLMNLEDIV